MLADDNKQILENVRELLSAEDCDIAGAVCDGQAVLDAAVKLHPDVVVLDISMPILNGIEAAKRLRQTNPDAKIVFLTVDNDPDICRAALETGALGYVWKPRMASDLVPAIKQAAGGRCFVSPGREPDVSDR